VIERRVNATYPTQSMTRWVEKVGGGSRLNDAETWLTNSSIADVAVVWAKFDGEIRAHRHALGCHRGVFAP
jgi:alkylation response protein AidB-like acyl-CoA dehydrogenase